MLGSGEQDGHRVVEQLPGMQVEVPNHGRIHRSSAIQSTNVPRSIANSFIFNLQNVLFGPDSILRYRTPSNGNLAAHRWRIIAQSRSCKPGGKETFSPAR